MSNRIGHPMTTYTGRTFWPLDPRPEEVCLEDIAHSLSHMARFNGHTKRFYSVAQHSIHLSAWVAEKHALHALLHDAAEAYVGDIIRPVKHALPEFDAIEKRVLEVILDGFELPREIPKEVFDADDRILHDERFALLHEDAGWGRREDMLGIQIPIWSIEHVKKTFMRAFQYYKRRRS